MRPKRLLACTLVSVTILGCVANRPPAKLDAAADLAGERLGQRPDWAASWDAAPPEWSGEAVLSADEAVALALRNNRMLRADVEMIGQADADLLQAGLLQNPMVSLMVMFPDGGGRSMLRGSGVPIQPLQDLWLIPARREVATAELQQAVLRVADRAIETATAVRTAYAKLQYTQRAIALIRDNVQLAEQSVRIIQTRQAVGQSSQVALNLARIRVLNLRSELLTMESDYRAEQRELLLLVGFAGAPDRWTVAPVHEMTDVLSPPGDEVELTALGREQRLDLKAAEWTVQAAERRIALMQREGWPDLSLGLSFERAAAPSAARGPTFGALAGNASAQAVTDRVYGLAPMPKAPMIAPWQPKMREMKWTLGPMLDLEVPLFDQNQAQVAKARHEYDQKRAEYEARAQEITRDIRAAVLRQRQAYDQVELYRSAILPEVERNLGLAQQAFVAGQEDLTIYLLAQEDVIMTRRKVLEFLRDYYVSGVELERAVGGRIGAEPTREGEAPAEPRSAAPTEVSHERQD
jgi:cobalt-zinc-cadmium efflux system outer membrane protein